MSSLGKKRGFLPAQGGGNSLPQEPRLRHQVVNVAEGFGEWRHHDL
jgi:hypothetical protein